MMRPDTSTEMRSASWKTACMSCSMSTMPSWLRRLSSKAIMPVESPMPAIGSSSSNKAGEVASARPTSSCRCSPWARWPARISRRAASPMRQPMARASSNSAPSASAGFQKTTLLARPARPARALFLSAPREGEKPGVLGGGWDGLVYRGAGDVVSVEGDAASIGGDGAGNLLNQRRLASPVGADDGVYLAVPDVQIQVVGGNQAAVAFYQLVQAEHIGIHALLPRWRQLARPLGNSSTTPSRMAPRMSCQWMV